MGEYKLDPKNARIHPVCGGDAGEVIRARIGTSDV